VAYGAGDGVAQDAAEAVKWYRHAAEQGLAQAQYNLALAYEVGDGVQQDFEEAVKWYRKAAEQGVAQAQFNLGFFYANGDGVQKDLLYAHMWWNLVASQGYEIALEYRQKVAEIMTDEQIEEAQLMAQECVRREYKDC